VLEQERIEVDAEKLITWTHALHSRTLRMLASAEDAGDRNNGRGLIAEARKNLELLRGSGACSTRRPRGRRSSRCDSGGTSVRR
jgi:hypothetical protein